MHIPFARVPAWFGCTERALTLNLLLPQDGSGEKRPLLIWVCGGAFTQMNQDVWMTELAWYAHRGFAVASVEYRVAAEAPFPAALMDVKAAIRFLRANEEKYRLDGGHFFIMGESAGGQLAALAGLTAECREYDTGDYLEFDSGVQGVVDYYGPADVTVFGDDTPWNPFWIRQFCFADTEKERRSLRKKASPVSYVTGDAKRKNPFLIFHGDQDSLVPLSQSEAFYEKLKENGYPVEFTVIRGGEHGSKEFYQPEVKAEILKFFKNLMDFPG